MSMDHTIFDQGYPPSPPCPSPWGGFPYSGRLGHFCEVQGAPPQGWKTWPASEWEAWGVEEKPKFSWAALPPDFHRWNFLQEPLGGTAKGYVWEPNQPLAAGKGSDRGKGRTPGVTAPTQTPYGQGEWSSIDLATEEHSTGKARPKGGFYHKNRYTIPERNGARTGKGKGKGVRTGGRI